MQKQPVAYSFPQIEESQKRSKIELIANVNRNNSDESIEKNPEDINRDMLLLRKLLEPKPNSTSTQL